MKGHILVFGLSISLNLILLSNLSAMAHTGTTSVCFRVDHMVSDSLPAGRRSPVPDSLRQEERRKRREERSKWQEEAKFFRPDVHYTYKGSGSDTARLLAWRPKDWKPEGKHAAILFIHGGRWGREDPQGVFQICAWFGRQGIVAFAMELSSNPADSQYISRGVVDARDAFQWIRTHAVELGIDTARLFAGGSSSGGHLAASLATIRCPLPDLSCADPYPMPRALLLFNPAVELDSNLVARASLPRPTMPLETLSPYHRIHREHPPTLIFHGTEDRDIAISYSQRYVKRLRKLGVNGVLEEIPGALHGFFKTSQHFQPSMERGLRFLNDIQTQGKSSY